MGSRTKDDFEPVMITVEVWDSIVYPRKHCSVYKCFIFTYTKCIVHTCLNTSSSKCCVLLYCLLCMCHISYLTKPLYCSCWTHLCWFDFIWYLKFTIFQAGSALGRGNHYHHLGCTKNSSKIGLHFRSPP